MGELFRPSAVAVDEYHDAANPNDDPQIEATRRLPQRQRAGPRRRISVTEREELAAAAAAATNNASAEAPPPQRLNAESVTIDVPTFSARSNTGPAGSSVAFSYKDLYGSDDEEDFMARNSDWKHQKRQRQQSDDYSANSADDNNVVEVTQGQTDFSNRNGRRLRANTFDSGLSGCSNGFGDSMVSVNMAPDNKNAEFDSISGLISHLHDDDDDKIPKQNCGDGDEYSNDQSSCSESEKEKTTHTDEPQASLLTSAVESLKQLPLFGRTNSSREDIPVKKLRNLSLQRLDGELVTQEKSNNHADESDHSDASSSASSHHPLHLTQPERIAKPKGGSDDNSLSSVSDSSKNHRKSSDGIPFFGRFQKQSASKHETNKSEAEVIPNSNKEEVDDDTPSTNSTSCPSPDFAPNLKVGEEHAQSSLLESMAQKAQLELNEIESNLQSIHTTENMGTRGTYSSIPLTESGRGSLVEIFTAALSNDDDGARETMGEDEKAQIINQLQLLAKMDSERSGLRETRGDSDESSGTPRFRPSIVEDFTAAAQRGSFHRRLSNDGSLADPQDTLDWSSSVSSLESPRTAENTTQNEQIEDNTLGQDDAKKETDSADTQSKRSKEGSIELDLSGRNLETSNVEHGNSLEASIEWPTSDASYSKLSCDDATAHKNAIRKTASGRSLVQSFRRTSLKILMNDTKSENSETDSGAEVAVERSDDVKAETLNVDEETETNHDVEHIQRPSISSPRRSSSQSTHRSPKSWGRIRRASIESETSMSSLESFASATNRAIKKGGNLASVKSEEAMSSFGSVTSALYQDEDKKEDAADDQEEFTVAIEDLNESPGNVVTYPPGMRQLYRNSFKTEKKSDRRTSEASVSMSRGSTSMSIDDFDCNSSSSGRPSMGRQYSGLADDVPLLLNSATSLISHYSTDGIEHIDPSAADSDDFDFAMNAYADGIKYGHFDVQADLNGDSATEDDHLLAAKAYMGLGFARQCRGELASSLDAYTKALQLCEAEIGPDDPINAILQYACGNVLNEMERYLEASMHFRQALRFYKSKESDGVDARVNILFIEGMMLSALEEANQAVNCFREGLRLYHTSQRPLNLKLASVMYEMGSLLSQNGEYIESASFFKFALHVRKSKLGDSFVVARTHYSLGVTLASQEVLNNTTTDAFSHLEEALRICQQEFEGDNLQTAVILHAMGVLKERKGDFLAASSWFKGERDMLISLFGEDHYSVVSISSDLGTCYYNVGKYELAKNMFQDALRIMTLSEAERSLEVADALYKIASCHDSLCHFDEALEAFYRVKQIRQQHFGMENGLVVQTMLRIGNVLLCQGEASSALECFGEVLGIGYASDSVNAIEVANALYGRGCAQFCGFQLSDAMKSFSESLNWKLAALGENDPGLACIFYQMAHVHLEQSENEEAITYFEEYARLLKLDPQRNLHDNAEICFTEGIIAKMKENFEAALSLYKTALVMFDTLFGGIHEKIASIHFEIGCVMSELDDSEEVALRHFKECLLQRKQLLGSHVDVANVLLEMASIYTKINDFESAERCLEESDRIWKSKLGNSSEKLTSVLMISGKRWKSIHCYQEAEANFEQALEIAITIHGQKHELVADILLDLGELLQEISQTQQAFFCFNESIEIRSTLFGPDSPNVAKAEYSKGVAHIFQGQFDEAANCLNRALTIRQETLGPMDSAVGDTLNTIGFLQLKMGNIEGRDALDPLMEALEIRRSVGNKGKVVSTLQNILSLYKKRKDYDSCIEVNADILAVRQDDFGPTHERVAEAWLNLGNVQASAGKFNDARMSYEEALRVRTANFGYQHRLVAQVLFKLGSLNSRQNNFDDAKQLFEEYIRIRAEEESDPDEEMAQALTLMGDLQKETGEKSKAQINWMSAIEIYHQLGYEDDHKKVMRLHARQKSLGMVGLFGGFRKSSGSLADNLSVLGLKFGGDDNASTISKLTMQL